MTRNRQPLQSIILSCPGLRGGRYQIIRPTKSFFSPEKGIPEGTVVMLTDNIRLEVRVKETFTGTLVPHVTVYLGVSWGRNMKGTDWVTLTRFRHNAVACREPAPK